jgi:hypothetical protein
MELAQADSLAHKRFELKVGRRFSNCKRAIGHHSCCHTGVDKHQPAQHGARHEAQASAGERQPEEKDFV